MFPLKKYNKISYEFLSQQPIIVNGYLGTPKWGVCVCVCVVLILFTLEKSIHRNEREGRLGGSVVERLPSAQVMVPGSWDRAPHRAPCSAGSLLLPLPLLLPLLMLSLSLSQINKQNIL